MTRASHLRAALVAHLRAKRVVTDERVLQALAEVPREAFAHDVATEVAYEDRAIPLKTEGERVLSSISQPGMVGQMLELLDVHPGIAVLEIGTGSGYTTAVLSQLAGPAVTVRSIDIERDLVDAANARFAELGVHARADVDDAATLQSVTGEFDRMLVTAKAVDIPRVWVDRLRDGGRLVAPLDLGLGAEAAFAFVKDGAMLHSAGAHACVFLPLRGYSDSTQTGTFFRTKSARYHVSHATFAHAAIDVVAADSVDAAWLERYDIVAVRAHSAFGVTLEP